MAKKVENILIVGNFGYKSNKLDGQTIKTRVVMEGIKCKVKDSKVIYIDSDTVNYILFIIKLLFYCCISNKIIVLPGKKAMKVVMPIVTLFKIFNKDIRYIVIGGWLPEHLKRNKYLLFLCKMFDGIYVELNSMVYKLNDIGVYNVEYMPNSRFLNGNNIGNNSKNEKNSPFKLVFLSRVRQDKGIELIIKAIEEINVELDVYGQVDKDYEKRFYTIINSSKNVKYNGVVEQKDINKILQKYDLLVFPTYYEGEGFPGVILDGMIANIPIICSDWKYNNEIIKNGYTGYIFKAKDIDDLKKVIIKCINDKEDLKRIKQNQVIEVKKYDILNVLDIIISKWS